MEAVKDLKDWTMSLAIEINEAYKVSRATNLDGFGVSLNMIKCSH